MELAYVRTKIVKWKEVPTEQTAVMKEEIWSSTVYFLFTATSFPVTDTYEEFNCRNISLIFHCKFLLSKEEDSPTHALAICYTTVSWFST